MKRIQSALEKIKAADKIQETMAGVVVRELNEISKIVQRIYRQKLAKLVIKVTIK